MKLKKCPLCEEGNIKHKKLKTKTDYPSNGITYVWICDDCPMIMFEYYNKNNTVALNNYLK